MDHDPQTAGDEQGVVTANLAGVYGIANILHQGAEIGRIDEAGVAKPLRRGTWAAHHQDPVVLGVRQAKVDVGTTPRGDPLHRILNAQDRFVHGPVQMAEPFLDDRKDQLIAVGEVQVYGRWGHPYSVGDGANREGRFIAGLQEQALGRLQDLLPQPLTFASSSPGTPSTRAYLVTS
jgi:hypothetical protein